MANTKVIKKRIKTAENIAQITKAMEMVSASKMRRSQQQALSSRPYSDSLRKILYSLLENADNLNHPLMKKNKSKNTAILVISTDKGLCGGLNTNLFRFLKNFCKDFDSEKLKFLAIGKKGREFLLKSGYSIIADFPQIKENVVFEDTIEVSRFLINAYLNNELGEVYISFSDFISTLSQKPKMVKILPVQLKDISKYLALTEELEIKPEEKINKKEYLFEPNAKQISSWLLPYFVELEIYHYFLEAKAAEHSSRMITMKNASENANEIVSELNLNYNKARQNQITSQIAEIATASMAMAD